MQYIDYIGIQVSNITEVTNFYCEKFNLKLLSKIKKPNTSFALLKHGEIKVKLYVDFDAIDNDNTAPRQILDDVGFYVDDVQAQYEKAIKNGFLSVQAPTTEQQDEISVCTAKVSAFGKVIHTFINRSPSKREDISDTNKDDDSQLFSAIDHFAVCVNIGEVDRYVSLYCQTFDMHQSYEEYVKTEKSGMNSKVVESQNGRIKIVFVEPISGERRSQISDYLDYYSGPCVQHVAFATRNMLSSVKKLRERGVNFLSVPEDYYHTQRMKLNLNDEIFEDLRSQSILVDSHENGYLYQIFTKSLTPKPELFFEVIQRIDCSGFGSGNIRALFQSIEKEQLANESVY